MGSEVFEHLPADVVVVSANKHDKSTWGTMACIDTEMKDGTHKKYFLMSAEADPTGAATAMTRGEQAATYA